MASQAKYHHHDIFLRVIRSGLLREGFWGSKRERESVPWQGERAGVKREGGFCKILSSQPTATRPPLTKQQSYMFEYWTSPKLKFPLDFEIFAFLTFVDMHLTQSLKPVLNRICF